MAWRTVVGIWIYKRLSPVIVRAIEEELPTLWRRFKKWFTNKMDRTKGT